MRLLKVECTGQTCQVTWRCNVRPESRRYGAKLPGGMTGRGTYICMYIHETDKRSIDELKRKLDRSLVWVVSKDQVQRLKERPSNDG